MKSLNDGDLKTLELGKKMQTEKIKLKALKMQENVIGAGLYPKYVPPRKSLFHLSLTPLQEYSLPSWKFIYILRNIPSEILPTSESKLYRKKMIDVFRKTKLKNYYDFLIVRSTHIKSSALLL